MVCLAVWEEFGAKGASARTVVRPGSSIVTAARIVHAFATVVLLVVVVVRVLLVVVVLVSVLEMCLVFNILRVENQCNLILRVRLQQCNLPHHVFEVRSVPGGDLRSVLQQQFLAAGRIIHIPACLIVGYLLLDAEHVVGVGFIFPLRHLVKCNALRYKSAFIARRDLCVNGSPKGNALVDELSI